MFIRCLERHADCKVERQIAPEVRMNQRIVRLVLRLVGRIDGLHTQIKAQDEIVEVQSYTHAVAHGQIVEQT